MNKKITFFPPIVCTVLLFLPPVWLHATFLRVPNPQQPTQGGILPSASGSIADIRDIYGPVLLPEQPPYLLYGAGLVLSLLLILALWLIWRYVRKKKGLKKVDPALHALSSLSRAEAGLSESGILLFAAEVSRILRSYIEAQFSVPATRCTTAEFFSRIESPFENQFSLTKDDTILKQCLTLCDRIKFSRYHPDHEAVNLLAENVRCFIETTRTRPVEEK